MKRQDATSPGKTPIGHKLPLSAWAAYAVVAGAGLILGAFLSRTLAELPLPWLLYSGRSIHWGLTLILTLGVGAAFVGIYALRAKTRDLQPDVLYPPDAILSSCIPLYLLVLYLAQPAPNLLQAGVLFGGALMLSLLLSGPPGLDAEWPVWLLLFMVPLIAYLNTLMPAVGTRDGYELQAISATLGFAHPTGYPLFPILGRLWIAIFPFGSIAWRINVLCALFAAASVPLVYGTARRVLDRPLAAWSALLYAFSHTLWTQASQPEKYTLNALFVALILYVTFGPGAGSPSFPEPRGPHPHLRWLGFLYGLSLTHHRTMLMLAPALALYLVGRERFVRERFVRGVRRRDPELVKRLKEWLLALGIALAPLTIYLYIPWRAYAQGWAMTPSEFLRYISGTHYGPAVRLMDWANPDRALMFWRFLVGQFGYVGIALGTLGLVGLALRRQWRFLISTALAYATYYVWGTVWYAYYNDVNSFIPNHLILAIWIGSGVVTAWGAIDCLVARSSSRAAVQEGAADPSSTKTARWQRVYRAALWSLAALMPMWMIWTNGPQVDKSDEWESTRWGENAIASDRGYPLDIVPNATILADREKHPPLDYFARVEQQRPDVDVVLLGDEQAYLDRLAWDLAHGTPVYLARFLPGLDGPYHLSSAGPLVKVSTTPLTEVEELEGPPAIFQAPDGTVIELLGYRSERDRARERDRSGGSLATGESLRVTLFWTARAPIPGNYHVALRWVSATGQPWWTSSDHPVNGMYPTAAWKPGEIVADWHEVPVDQALPPGAYTLEVGLFQPFSQGRTASPGEGLPADGTEGLWAPLTMIAVTPGPASLKLPHRLHAVAPGQLLLLGYDLPEQAPPTGRVTLRLYWRPCCGSRSPALPDYQIGTRVIATGKGRQGADSEQGRALSTDSGPTPKEPALSTDSGPTSKGWTWTVPGRGEYPTSSWTPGMTVLTEHTLNMPSGGRRATVQIAVREDNLVLFYPRWLAPGTTVLSLPPIQIAGRSPATPGAVNFGDLILLLADDLEQRTLSPGAPLELTVRWQGMQPMDADYTLFIHILAPDGTIKGQIDVWPKDGTHPTSQWRPGEAFEDRYLLYVDPDAPPGAYQVEIGWYLLETMQRLPVLDAQGRAIDDKILLSGLTVP